MKISIVKGYIEITASAGKFLIKKDGSVYGTKIVLGKRDYPSNYIEKKMSEYPKEDVQVEDEVKEEENDTK